MAHANYTKYIKYISPNITAATIMILKISGHRELGRLIATSATSGPKTGMANQHRVS